MVAAAILAGGKGVRLGGDLPKQFLDLCGEPVLLRTLRAFVNGGVDRCVVCVPAGYAAYCEALVRGADLPASCPVSVTAGGATRGDSLVSALSLLEAEGVLDDCILLTHDAVRPFVTPRMIADNAAAARRFGACCTCVPATDTVFLSADGETVSSVPDRKTVFHAQTPQSFRAAELLDLIRRIPPEDFAALTDGCSVYTYFGKPVAMVPGDRDNIKLTYPEDLDRAAEIVARRRI